MSDPTSRHDGAPTYAVEVDGDTVDLYQPRALPPAQPAVRHRVAEADRLDLIAARYFGSPYEYWRIADANPVLIPEDLLDPGVAIVIPKRK